MDLLCAADDFDLVMITTNSLKLHPTHRSSLWPNPWPWIWIWIIFYHLPFFQPKTVHQCSHEHEISELFFDLEHFLIRPRNRWKGSRPGNYPSLICALYILSTSRQGNINWLLRRTRLEIGVLGTPNLTPLTGACFSGSVP